MVKVNQIELDPVTDYSRWNVFCSTTERVKYFSYVGVLSWLCFIGSFKMPTETSSSHSLCYAVRQVVSNNSALRSRFIVGIDVSLSLQMVTCLIIGITNVEIIFPKAEGFSPGCTDCLFTTESSIKSSCLSRAVLKRNTPFLLQFFNKTILS